jgi:hypothetical protein
MSAFSARRVLFSVALLLVSGAAALGADSPTKYDLRYKFKPGEVVRTKVIHQAAIRTTIDGSSQTAATVSTSIKVWKIEDVSSAGQIKFVHCVDHVKMRNAVSGREDVHYDSNKDQTPPPGFEDVAKRVGVPLTVVTIDNRGNILKREERVAPGPGQGSQLTFPLPKQPVAVGESWTIPNDMRIRLQSGELKNIQSRQKFTLEAVEGDIARIKVETQVLTPVRDPEIEAQLIENETNGTVRFNIAQGRLAGQQIDLDRQVVGYPNAKSSMHYKTRFTEELLAGDPPQETPQTAEKENVLRSKK